jgi:class 3 adenylate cyclase/predicted ATPase
LGAAQGMSEVRKWLEGIGLGRYADAFDTNEIGMDLLGRVDDQMLKDIGVSIGGHRLRIRNAIAKLAPAPVNVVKLCATAPTHETTAGSAERRQLTVMFCDLVGSTELSARLDPEDLRTIVGFYHRCCAEVITKSGGFVAKYMGDGVLAYFGYPQAHEDDAERAVRAGLALVEAVPKLDGHGGTALQMRIGISTGLVVVGDLLGEGAAKEQAVVGETPNVAARLQALAEPGAVVIASSTRRLTRGLFEYRDLGTLALKGFAENVPAWQVVGLGALESRFEALRSATTPLVGRAEEVELLLRRWKQAKAGDGQVVLISGEPGIGKSRIAEAVMERISGQPHTRLRYFCSPHHEDSALYPSIAQLERAAGFRREDTPEQRLAKLEAVLAQGTKDLTEVIPLMADLLSIPTGDRYPLLNLTPQKRKERTLHAQLDQVDGLAARQPVLMVFEDVHWSDPTTCEGLDLIVDRVPTLRVLVILTFRPEFTAPWIGRPHVTMLNLNRLPVRQRAEMIGHVTGGKALPKEIAEQIVDRTDGVPLFIEELTKSVVESGILTDAGDRYAVAGPVAPLAIPMSLHASLLARLDRLAPTREVAQIGAALGRSFSHELISAVAQMSQKQVDDGLAQLANAELIFRRGTPPNAEYTFKHALVQDAAHGTLLRDARRAIHGRIADVLERQFPEIAGSQPEVLARHYTEAGAIERAAGFWGTAGQRSLERSALNEAAEQLTRALSQIATLPSTPSSRRQEIMFQVALRHVLVHLKGYAAPETKAAVERTRQLIQQAEARGEASEDPLLLFSLLNSLWTGSIVSFSGEEACGLAAEFLARAERQKAAAPVVDGYRIVGTSLLMTGDIANGRAHFDRGITLCDSMDHAPSVTPSIGADAKVVMLGFRSIALWLLGNPKAALTDAEHALRRAREITPVGTLMHTLSWTILIRILCGDYVTASRLVNELVTLADDKSTSFWKAWGMMNKGLLLALTGKVLDAVHASTSGIAAWRSTGATMCLPYYSSCLAMSYAELGHFDDARCFIRKAMRTIEETKERWFEAEIYRMAGEIELKSPNLGGEKPEAYFARALSIARAQQAKSFELRAATSMARLWSEQAKRDEARNLLTPAYGWFTEGFDTLDLKAAKVLLDDLARQTAK